MSSRNVWSLNLSLKFSLIDTLLESSGQRWKLTGLELFPRFRQQFVSLPLPVRHKAGAEIVTHLFQGRRVITNALNLEYKQVLLEMIVYYSYSIIYSDHESSLISSPKSLPHPFLHQTFLTQGNRQNSTLPECLGLTCDQASPWGQVCHLCCLCVLRGRSYSLSASPWSESEMFGSFEFENY